MFCNNIHTDWFQASHSTLNEIDDSFSRQTSYRYYTQQQEDPIYQNQQQVSINDCPYYRFFMPLKYSLFI